MTADKGPRSNLNARAPAAAVGYPTRSARSGSQAVPEGVVVRYQLRRSNSQTVEHRGEIATHRVCEHNNRSNRDNEGGAVLTIECYHPYHIFFHFCVADDFSRRVKLAEEHVDDVRARL